MDNLTTKVFFTSLIFTLLITGYIKIRDESGPDVSDIEKYTVIAIWILNFAVLVVSALAVIWVD